MLTIGFTNTFYTLWSVSEPYKVYTGEGSYMKCDCHFIQNLSTDFETAKQKASEHGEYVIDLSMRGEYGYGNWEETPKQVEQPIDCFPFGKECGNLIMDSDNVWQLNRLYEFYKDKQIGARRAVLARRRLVELGELIRKDWIENIKLLAENCELRSDLNFGETDKKLYPQWTVVEEVYGTKEIKYKYATKWKLKQLGFAAEKKAVEDRSGLWFTNGEKVKLDLITIGQFSFNTQYGTTYVTTMEDKDGKVFKYKGTNPPSQFDSLTGIKATIKHSSYNGIDETLLLRIKEL